MYVWSNEGLDPGRPPHQSVVIERERESAGDVVDSYARVYDGQVVRRCEGSQGQMHDAQVLLLKRYRERAEEVEGIVNNWWANVFQGGG